MVRTLPGPFREIEIMGRALLLALLFAFTTPAAAEGEEWVALKAEYEKAFDPLPVKRMFSDPMKELELSRRAPHTDSARTEIARARAKLKLRRARIRDERRKREGIVERIGASGPRSPPPPGSPGLP